MTIYNISDFSDFFKTLDSCGDDLTLITPDGHTYDWKTNRAFLLSFLQTVDIARCNAMEIKAANAADASRLFCYMLEGNASICPKQADENHASSTA